MPFHAPADELLTDAPGFSAPEDELLKPSSDSIFNFRPSIFSDNAESAPALPPSSAPSFSFGPAPFPVDEPTKSDFARGANVSLRQLPQLAYGTAGLIGATGEKVFGIGKGLKDWGLSGYQEASEKIRPFESENDDVTVAWKKAKAGDIGAMVDWVQYGLGYTLGQAGETIAMSLLGGLIGGAGGSAVPVAGTAAGAAGGAVTGLVAKGAVKKAAFALIEKAIAKETAEILARKGAANLTAAEVRKQAVKAIGKEIGSTTAIVANSLGMELGSIYPEAEAHAAEQGRTLTGSDLARVWGTGIVAGGLDAITDKLGLDLAKGKFAGTFGKNRVTAALGAGASGLAVEGTTEFAQTGLERLGAGKPVTGEEARREYINATALGALGGGVVGGGAGFLGGGRRDQEPPPAAPEVPPAAPASPAEVKGPPGEPPPQPFQTKLAQELVAAAEARGSRIKGKLVRYAGAQKRLAKGYTYDEANDVYIPAKINKQKNEVTNVQKQNQPVSVEQQTPNAPPAGTGTVENVSGQGVLPTPPGKEAVVGKAPAGAAVTAPKNAIIDAEAHPDHLTSNREQSDVWRAAMKKTGEDFVDEPAKDSTNPKKNTILSTDDSGKVNGSITYGETDVWVYPKGGAPLKQKLGIIGFVSVHPDAQGKGVGAKLMDAALAKFQAQGVNTVKIEASFGSNKFYDKYFKTDAFSKQGVQKISIAEWAKARGKETGTPVAQAPVGPAVAPPEPTAGIDALKPPEIGSGLAAIQFNDGSQAIVVSNKRPDGVNPPPGAPATGPIYQIETGKGKVRTYWNWADVLSRLKKYEAERGGLKPPTNAPAPSKETAPVEAELDEKNPYAGELNKARLAIKILEPLAAKNPKLYQSDLAAARAKLAEVQKWYDAGKKPDAPPAPVVNPPEPPTPTDPERVKTLVAAILKQAKGNVEDAKKRVTAAITPIEGTPTGELYKAILVELEKLEGGVPDGKKEGKVQGPVPVVPPTPAAAVKPAAAQTAAQKLAAKIRAAKLKNERGETYITIVPPPIWNGAMEVLATTIEAGGKVADAVAAALNYIRQNIKEAWDESAAKKALYELTGEPEPVEAPDEKPKGFLAKKIAGGKDNSAEELKRVEESIKKKAENGPLEEPPVLQSTQEKEFQFGTWLGERMIAYMREHPPKNGPYANSTLNLFRGYSEWMLKAWPGLEQADMRKMDKPAMERWLKAMAKRHHRINEFGLIPKEIVDSSGRTTTITEPDQSHNSIKRGASALDWAFRAAHDTHEEVVIPWKINDVDVTRAGVIPLQPISSELITPDTAQTVRLIGQFAGRMLDLAKAFLYTGLRTTELLRSYNEVDENGVRVPQSHPRYAAARWSEMDRSNPNQWKLNISRKRLKVPGKSLKDMVIELTPEATEYFKQLEKDNPHSDPNAEIFGDIADYNLVAFNKAVTKAALEIGIKIPANKAGLMRGRGERDLGNKLFRKMFAVYMGNNGMPIQQIAALMGNTPETIRKWYEMIPNKSERERLVALVKPLLAQPIRVEKPGELSEQLVDRPSVVVLDSQIAIRPKLMQYKQSDETGASETHKKTVVGEKWDDVYAENLLLWEPANPAEYGLTGNQKYILVDGHGRVLFGRKQGRKGYNAIILKEAKTEAEAGFSASDARIYGALKNIKTDRGTVYDNAKFLRDTAAARGKDAAMERARQEGIRDGQASAIAFDSTDDVWVAFINDRISPDQAEAIAKTAPNNAPAQQLGIDLATDKKNPRSGEDIAGILQQQLNEVVEKVQKGQQGVLWATNDSMIAAWAAQWAKAKAVIAASRKDIQAAKNAAKNPEAANRSGVDVADPEGSKKRIAELEVLIERLKKNPKLADELAPPPATGLKKKDDSERPSNLSLGPGELSELRTLRREKAAGTITKERATKLERLEADGIVAELFPEADFLKPQAPAPVAEKPKPKPSAQLDLFGNLSGKTILLFQNEQGKFVVTTDGKTPEGAVWREVRAETKEDILALLDRDDINLDEGTRKVLRTILTSPAWAKLPPFKLAVSNWIKAVVGNEDLGTAGEMTFDNSWDSLMRLTGKAKAPVAAEEALHHIFNWMKSEDRQLFIDKRNAKVTEELAQAYQDQTQARSDLKDADAAGQTKASKEIGERLENLDKRIAALRKLKDMLTSAEFFEQGLPRDLYHLANGSEYWAYLMSDRAVKEWTKSGDGGTLAKFKQLLRDIYQMIRRAFKLTERDEEIWQDMITGNYEYHGSLQGYETSSAFPDKNPYPNPDRSQAFGLFGLGGLKSTEELEPIRKDVREKIIDSTGDLTQEKVDRAWELLDELTNPDTMEDSARRYHDLLGRKDAGLVTLKQELVKIGIKRATEPLRDSPASDVLLASMAALSSQIATTTGVGGSEKVARALRGEQGTGYNGVFEWLLKVLGGERLENAQIQSKINGKIFWELLNGLRTMKLSKKDFEDALEPTKPGEKTVEEVVGKKSGEIEDLLGEGWFKELAEIARGFLKKRGFPLGESPMKGMFPKAGYRKFYTEKGADQFVQNFFALLSNSSDPEAKREGNVWTADRLLSAELRRILKQAAKDLGFEPKPNDPLSLYDKVVQVLGKSGLSGTLRQEKINEIDKRIRDEIEAMREQAVEPEEGIEESEDEAIARESKLTRADLLENAWNEIIGPLSNAPASRTMLDRIISDQMKQGNFKWSQAIKDPEVKTKVVDAALEAIREASTEGEYTNLDLNGMRAALQLRFDAQQALMQAKMDAAAALRVKQVKKTLATDPDGIAQRIIDRLQVKETEWLKPDNTPEILKVIKEFYASKPTIIEYPDDEQLSGLVDALMTRGAMTNKALAQRLAREMYKEAETRWANANYARAESISRSSNVRSLVESILRSPLRAQSDPDWVRETAILWFQSNGLTPDRAAQAWTLFRDRFETAFQKAREKVANEILKDRPIRTQDELVKLIRSGVLNPDGEWITKMAEQNGWKKPTAKQYADLLDLDEQLHNEEAAALAPEERKSIIEGMHTIIRHIGKRERSAMNAVAESFAASLLTGIRTLTVQLGPFIAALRDIGIMSAFDPKNTLNWFRSVHQAAKHNIVSQAKYTWQKNISFYHIEDLEFNYHELQRVHEDTMEVFKNGSSGQKVIAAGKWFYAQQRYILKTLATMDSISAAFTREYKLAYYSSLALKEAGFSTGMISELLDMQAAAYDSMYEFWSAPKQGLNDDTVAQLRANKEIDIATREFLGDKKVPQELIDAVFDSVEKDYHSVTGRRAPGVSETDEGLLSKPMNAVLEFVGKQKAKGGWSAIAAQSIFGFISLPWRATHYASSFMWYGLVRGGIDEWRKNHGGKTTYWKQSYGNVLQSRMRFREALAGTIVGIGAGVLVGLHGSADDDDDEKGTFAYITGNGPVNKNLRDAWIKKGFQPHSIHFVNPFNKKFITVPLTRIGEFIMYPFIIAAGIDDAKWKQKERAATGKPPKEPISLYAATLVGEHMSMMGQRGLFQTGAQLHQLTQGSGSFAKGVTRLVANTASGIAVPYRQLLASISDMFVGPLDNSSASSLVANALPLIGLPWQQKATNRLGDPLHDRSWYGRLSRTGIPVAFQVADNPENRKLYTMMVDKGYASPPPLRSSLEERFGPMSNEDYSRLTKKSGDILKRSLLSDYNAIAKAEPDEARKMIQKLTRSADKLAAQALGLESLKPSKSTGGISLGGGGGGLFSESSERSAPSSPSIRRIPASIGRTPTASRRSSYARGYVRGRLSSARPRRLSLRPRRLRLRPGRRTMIGRRRMSMRPRRMRMRRLSLT